MSDGFSLPFADGAPTLQSSRLLPATDAHLRRPAASAPKLYQFLPDSSHVEPPYTIAGVHAGSASTSPGPLSQPADVGHSVTALYTPDGTCSYQRRILACRLTLSEADRPYSDDSDGGHDEYFDETFVDDDLMAYTDWVDTTVTHDTVEGFDRTVVAVREPVLTAPNGSLGRERRPVVVHARLVQTAPWGVIEVGTYHSPAPDLGSARATVTALAATLTDRVERHPRPTADDEWPLFFGHDLDRADLATAMRATLTDLTTESHPGNHEEGALLCRLLDRFTAEYDLTRDEARVVLETLVDRGGADDSAGGLIKLA